MNLRAIAASARDQIFKLTESVAVTGVYHRIVGGDYTVATGVGAQTDTTYNVSARTGMFSQKEIDGESVKAGDKKFIIDTTEMSGAPTSNDYFVDASGIRWDMMEIGKEPTGSVLIMRGRAHAT